MSLPATRYDRTAATLHWASAALILALFWLGFTFARMPAGPDRVLLCTWHKTLGFVLLALAVARIVHRLRHPAPPLPTTMPERERLAATVTHRAVYALLLVVPLTGIAAASDAAKPGIRLLFGIVAPSMPLPGDMILVHMAIAYAMGALLLVHIAAGVWHQFIRRDLAGRMPPFGGAPDEAAIITALESHG